MPISRRLLEKASNRCIVAPAWIIMDDWLQMLATDPLATPLIDFGKDKTYRVGVTTLNWYLMDLLSLRRKWLSVGWQSHSELWLLINPMRYRLLGHQPKQPYPCDVRDFLQAHYPTYLQHPLLEHPHFAWSPCIQQQQSDDIQVAKSAKLAPWKRVAVVDESDDIIGMVWHSNGKSTLPAITNYFIHQ